MQNAIECGHCISGCAVYMNYTVEPLCVQILIKKLQKHLSWNSVENWCSVDPHHFLSFLCALVFEVCLELHSLDVDFCSRGKPTSYLAFLSLFVSEKGMETHSEAHTSHE